MGLTEKAKGFADIAFEKLGVFGERAATKVAELSGAAREKTPGYLDRAADVAGRAVETTAARVDKATGGRYHDKIQGASAKVGETLDRTPGPAAPGTGTSTSSTGTPSGPVAVPPASDVAGQAGTPVTPASTNPDATTTDAAKSDSEPDVTKPGTTRPGSPGPGTIPGPTR
jgi:hypothetical protein